LLIQIQLKGNNFNVALEQGEFVAIHTLSLLSFSFSSVTRPRLLWAYDSTPNVDSREFRQCLRPTRRLNDANLFKVLEKSSDWFLSDPSVKDVTSNESNARSLRSAAPWPTMTTC
jgi:hypothetical protein